MNRGYLKYLLLALGPVFFIFLVLAKPFSGLSHEGTVTLALTLWAGLWWIVEVVPMAVTALLPIVILPLAQAAPINQTTAAYGDKMLFLFIGGFILAIAMEKWNLHKRIALHILNKSGSKPANLLLGFMLATALISMWISNTATTLMMVTIGMAIIFQIPADHSSKGGSFSKSLLLGIAYAASIGGTATIIGTPTNPIFVAMAFDWYGTEINFLQWMSIGLPFSLILLAFAWFFLAFPGFKLHKSDIGLSDQYIKQEIKALGKMSQEEKSIAFVFGITAFMWVSHSLWLTDLLPGINDTSIAIGAAVSLFILPSRKEKRMGILSWDEAVKLPWGVILLFGGGLSLAAAFKSSGLAAWLGEQMGSIQGFPPFLTVLIITLLVNFLTEITSNVATVSISLPVLAALSPSLDIHPFMLMIPATLAGSCAFMLPVATAPNAIVFGSGLLKVKEMARTGLILNLFSSILIAILCYAIIPYFF